MKVKRFLAVSVKAALAQVKERLGVDAVILSNRATPEGVEVLAIAEGDMSSMSEPTEGALARAEPPAGFTTSFRRGNDTVSSASNELNEAFAGTRGTSADSPPAHAAKVANAIRIANAMKQERASKHATSAADAPGASTIPHAARVEHAPLPDALPPAPIPVAAASPSYQRHERQAQARALEILQRDPAPTPEREVDFLVPRAPAQAPINAATSNYVTPNAKVRSFSFADLIHRPVAEDRAPRGRPAAQREAAADSQRSMRVQPTVAPAARAANVEPERNGGIDLLGEIRALRGFVESRLATAGWSDDMRRRPVAASLMRELLAAGFSTTLARAATSAVPELNDAKEGRAWLHTKLVERLQVTSPGGDIVEHGGVYALTGPTGAGKTTTTAKIAARCVVKYGAASLGLITTDTYRIGAHDQLKVFGKILGVQVHAVHDEHGLKRTLTEMEGKRLVLIDTIGLGQRDERVDELLGMLDACGVTRMLLLSATSQVETLEEVLEAFGTSKARIGPGGVIVTKLDEAAKLGGVVDVLVRHKLNVHFVGTGQRVPEDLAVPDGPELVRAALRVPRGGPFALSKDEASMLATAAMSAGFFGGEAHA
jgi:flagellar biosynthesis protein FlhF